MKTKFDVNDNANNYFLCFLMFLSCKNDKKIATGKNRNKIVNESIEENSENTAYSIDSSKHEKQNLVHGLNKFDVFYMDSVLINGKVPLKTTYPPFCNSFGVLSLVASVR